MAQNETTGTYFKELFDDIFNDESLPETEHERFSSHLDDRAKQRSREREIQHHLLHTKKKQIRDKILRSLLLKKMEDNKNTNIKDS